MTPAAFRALFRSEMGDEEEPYLWSDPEVEAYTEDAQSMFYRLTGGVRDASTAEIVEIEVTPAVEWYDTDPRILKVVGATRLDTGRPIEVVNYEDLPARNMRFDGRTGDLAALIIGMEPDRARVYPVPTEAVTVMLVVDRMPLGPVYPPLLTAAFEAEERHHLHMLSWVKHLAHLKQDSQTFDRGRSDEFEQRFRAYCRAVERERHRQRHKHRTVVYGGL